MSKQYPGGLITKTPVVPSGPYETSTASGIWTLDQQAYWRKLNQWPIAGSLPPDAQFNYVTTLLQGDGTNGAQNNTFLDSSTNNFTITRNGNTTQGTFTPYGSNWSNYFGTTTSNLKFASSASFAIGTGNFLMPFMHELKNYSNYTPVVNQIEFSPFLNLNEDLNYCRQHQICLQAYTPLMRGQKHDHPSLVAIADNHQRTPAQIILRWAVQQGISTIPKSGNSRRIKENFDIFNFELSAMDLQILNNLNENFRIVDNPMDML